MSPPPAVPDAWRFLACARSALGTTRMFRGHAETAGASSSGESLLASDSLAAGRSEADGGGSCLEEAASAAYAPCPGWFWYNRFCRSSLTRNSSLDSSCARFSARCSIFLICAVICGKLIFESEVMASASSASSSCLSVAASFTKRDGTKCLCRRGISRCQAQRERGTGEAADLSLLSRGSLCVTAALAVCITAGQAVALLESLVGEEQVFEHRGARRERGS